MDRMWRMPCQNIKLARYKMLRHFQPFIFFSFYFSFLFFPSFFLSFFLSYLQFHWSIFAITNWSDIIKFSPATKNNRLRIDHSCRYKYYSYVYKLLYYFGWATELHIIPYIQRLVSTAQRTTLCIVYGDHNENVGW